jgi:hypothetical protein
MISVQNPILPYMIGEAYHMPKAAFKSQTIAVPREMA